METQKAERRGQKEINENWKRLGACTDQEFNQIMNCMKNLEECYLKFFL